MNLGEILTKSWKIIWKQKILWLFGFLASFGQSRVPNPNTPGSENRGDLNIPQFEQYSNQFERWFESDTAWLTVAGILLLVFCLVLILGLIFTAISTMGRIGLIRGACLADTGAENLTFRQIWRDSKPYFWRVFLFALLLSVLSFLIALLLAVPFVLVTVFTLGCGLLLLVPLFMLAGWFVAVMIELTVVAMVSENLPITAAFNRAWDVVRDHPGPIASISLILLIGSTLIGLVLALPFLLVAIPAAVAIFAESKELVTTGLITAGVLLACLVPVMIALNSGLQAYLGTAWTLVFRRLTESKAEVNISDHSPVPPQSL